MTNDLVNQLFNQLQTSNELMALKAKCERLTEENERLTAENKRLTENINACNLIIGDIMAENKRLTKGGQS
jgi:regulator of replication initiation timing